MKRNKYFYFASPHSFRYPFIVYLIFKKKNGSIIHRGDYSKWIEVKNYTYYGEPVNCIIPAKILEYDFVFSLLFSENKDNVFGAINYMLCNYRKKFLLQINSGKCHCIATNIMFQYFRKDIQMER